MNASSYPARYLRENRRNLQSYHLGKEATRTIDFSPLVSNLEAVPVEKEKRITLIDLSKRLNLTVRAVSKALNGEDSTVRVSEETRKRVLALAKELNYRPNRIARTLRTGRSGMIGVLALQTFGYNVQKQLYLARRFADELGFAANIHLIPDLSDGSCDRALEIMLDSKMDGIVVFDDLGRTHMTQLRRMGLPLVTVGLAQVMGVPRYFADLETGVALLTRHMVDQGAGKIALLGEELSDSIQGGYQKSFLNGFQKGLRQAAENGQSVFSLTHFIKISREGCKIKAPQIHPLYAAGYLGMKELILSKRIPEALICQNDNLAYGAVTACAEFGIDIPTKMLLAGFGDDPICAGGPLLITSVRQPLDELCHTAINDLKAMMSNSGHPTNRCVTLPYELIVRTSTQSTIDTKIRKSHN